MAASAALLYGPLQVLEVALRNAVHTGLAGRFGADWHDQLDATLAIAESR